VPPHPTPGIIRDLHRRSKQLANVLRNELGIQEGARILSNGRGG
jgi:acyl-CoA synthetase (AMP-forming)/AMP-acid ligase II